jgi:large conductance mechanosensitive channel
VVKIWEEFKAFAFKGNLIDLAVAFVLGLAFVAVVNATVNDLITPIIGIFFGQSFDSLTFSINGSVFRYGDWLNALISFVIIAWVLFLIMKAVNLVRKPQVARSCPFCLEQVAQAATRCSHCTSELRPAA